METEVIEEPLEKRVKRSDKVLEWGINCVCASIATIGPSFLLNKFLIFPYLYETNINNKWLASKVEMALDHPIEAVYLLTLITGVAAGTTYCFRKEIKSLYKSLFLRY